MTITCPNSKLAVSVPLNFAILFNVECVSIDVRKRTEKYYCHLIFINFIVLEANVFIIPSSFFGCFNILCVCSLIMKKYILFIVSIFFYHASLFVCKQKVNNFSVINIISSTLFF
jgi:hypothetical protein